MKQGKTDIERYTRLVQSLNNPTITDEVEHIEHERLLEYFTTWIAADYDLKKWSMREQFRARLFNMRPVLKEEGGRPIVTVAQFKGSYQQFRQFEEMHVPMHQEAPDDLEEIEREMLEEAGESRAFKTFRQFLQSPFYNAIGQCLTCKRFYLMTTGHSGRKYCSQKCASKDTALKAMAKRNQRIKTLKLQAVRKAINDFKRLPKSKRLTAEASQGWKSWVANHANARLRRVGCRVSMTFVTRALNSREVTGPKI
jgi:Family of unknown function (DUF6076)